MKGDVVQAGKGSALYHHVAHVGFGHSANASTAGGAQTNLHTTTGNFLGSNQVLIKIILVQAKDRVDNHLREEGLLGVDEFGGHGSGGKLDEVLVEDPERSVQSRNKIVTAYPIRFDAKEEASSSQKHKPGSERKVRPTQGSTCQWERQSP